MIDTHAHIYDEAFNEDRNSMILRAFEAGVNEIWMPNCNSETINGMLALQNQYPGQCKAMMGLHPCYVKEDFKDQLGLIKEEFFKRNYFMVGEIGIDYYWDLSFIEQQKEAFLFQLELAKKYNIPICIHSRSSKDKSLNAIETCCDLIEEFNWKNLKGIFHCFSGDVNDANRVVNLGFKLGIGGVLTYKNSGLKEVVSEIGLGHLVLETDAPYLAPDPYRGKTNEVSYVKIIAEQLAKTLNVSLDEVLQITDYNALSLLKN